jgi:hypothetical protein
MKWLTAFIGGGAISLALLSSPAFATLHGWCGGGTTTLCMDNGTNSPFDVNPPNPFGFTSSPPGETGTLFLKVLVPDNETVAGPFAVTGAATATANLVTGTTPGPWTTGSLQDYLGIPFVGETPDNPIGAYLPSTQALDPGATGFNVYEADLGTQTIAGPSGPPNQLFDITGPPLASYLVAFIEFPTGGGEATANSGAIFITASCVPGTPGCNSGPPIPEPPSLALIGSGLVIFGFLWRRRSA